jgi:hypothetical protein
MTDDISSEAESLDSRGSRSASRLARQPALGVTGLLLVVPVAVLLAFAANGAEGSTILLGPFAVFALAPIAMIAFWWENWPGTRLRSSWSGWADTLLIAAIAVVMTMIGQRLVGHFDLQGIFSLNPAPTIHQPSRSRSRWPAPPSSRSCN